jgi:hypothetical protein
MARFLSRASRDSIYESNEKGTVTTGESALAGRADTRSTR